MCGVGTGLERDLVHGAAELWLVCAWPGGIFPDEVLLLCLTAFTEGSQRPPGQRQKQTEVRDAVTSTEGPSHLLSGSQLRQPGPGGWTKMMRVRAAGAEGQAVVRTRTLGGPGLGESWNASWQCCRGGVVPVLGAGPPGVFGVLLCLENSLEV